MTKEKTREPGTITIVTCDELREFAELFAAGEVKMLSVVSLPGLGKTQTFKEVMAEREHLAVSGHYTAFILYQRLYEFKDLPVVIDDADMAIYILGPLSGSLLLVRQARAASPGRMRAAALRRWNRSTEPPPSSPTARR